MNCQYNKNDIYSVMIYMQKQYGKEIFYKEDILYSYLSDLAPDLKQERRLLKMISQRKYFQQLDNIDTDVNLIIEKIKYYLTEDEMFREDKVQIVIDALKSVYITNYSDALENAREKNIRANQNNRYLNSNDVVRHSKHLVERQSENVVIEQENVYSAEPAKSSDDKVINDIINPKSTFPSNKKTVRTVIFILLIIGFGFGGYFYVYPNVAFKNAVAKKDYQKISELYDKHSYRIKNATEQIDLLVDELIALYMEEKITEEEFSEMYVLQYARLGKIVEEARAKTDVLRQSHAALEEGKNYVENSDYENAISCLDKVDISDKCYDESQKLLEECKDKYVSIIIADMKKAASEKVWKSAIRLCDKGSALDANAYDWKQSREQYIDELLNEAITKIEEKLNEGDVKQADEIVDDYSHYLYEEEKFIKIQQRVSGLIGS